MNKKKHRPRAVLFLCFFRDAVGDIQVEREEKMLDNDGVGDDRFADL